MLIKIVASAINVTRTVHRFLISLLSDPPFADVSAVTVIDERFLHGKHRENEGSQFSPSATLREALTLSNGSFYALREGPGLRGEMRGAKSQQ